MNNSRTLGTALIGIGFGLAVLVGLYLAVQVSSQALETGQFVVWAVVAFTVIAPIMIAGIYFYVREEPEDTSETEMERQRRLMEHLRERGQLNFQEAAAYLGVDEDTVREMVEQLVVLRVFGGYVQWGEGLVARLSDADLRQMQTCAFCGQPIVIQEAPGGMATCPHCGTEYYLTGQSPNN